MTKADRPPIRGVHIEMPDLDYAVDKLPTAIVAPILAIDSENMSGCLVVERWLGRLIKAN